MWMHCQHRALCYLLANAWMTHVNLLPYLYSLPLLDDTRSTESYTIPIADPVCKDVAVESNVASGGAHSRAAGTHGVLHAALHLTSLPRHLPPAGSKAAADSSLQISNLSEARKSAPESSKVRLLLWLLR